MKKISFDSWYYNCNVWDCELGWRIKIVVQVQKLLRLGSSMSSFSVDFYNCNYLSFNSRIIGATSPWWSQPYNMCNKKVKKKCWTPYQPWKFKKHLIFNYIIASRKGLGWKKNPAKFNRLHIAESLYYS